MLLLDDASTDGTAAAVLQRAAAWQARGPGPTLSLFSFHSPVGITAAWAHAWGAAFEGWGYGYLVLANNDVVIPGSSLAHFLACLDAPGVEWLGALSTDAGLGPGAKTVYEHQRLLHHHEKALAAAGLDGVAAAVGDAAAVQASIEGVGAEQAPLVEALPGDTFPLGFFQGFSALASKKWGLPGGVGPWSDSFGKNTGQEHELLMRGARAHVALRSFVWHVKGPTLELPGGDRDNLQKCRGPAPMPHPMAAELATHRASLATFLDEDGEPLRLARAAHAATRKYPISFSLSATKFVPFEPATPASVAALASSKQLWAPTVPGEMGTYIYGTDEARYFASYVGAWKGRTWAKSGVDCNRHVEIIACGCVPVFRDMDKVNDATMFAYPKKLMAHVEKAEAEGAEVRPAMLAVWREAFLGWGHKHLTNTAMVKYMAEVTGKMTVLAGNAAARVAFVDGNLQIKPDYQSIAVVLGLLEWLGASRVDVFFPPPYIYRGYNGTLAEKAHGKGIGFSRVVDALPNPRPLHEMVQALQRGEYEVVVYGNLARSTAFFANTTVPSYKGKKDSVWVVYGNDAFVDQGLPYDDASIFVRELKM